MQNLVKAKGKSLQSATVEWLNCTVLQQRRQLWKLSISQPKITTLTSMSRPIWIDCKLQSRLNAKKKTGTLTQRYQGLWYAPEKSQESNLVAANGRSSDAGENGEGAAPPCQWPPTHPPEEMGSQWPPDPTFLGGFGTRPVTVINWEIGHGLNNPSEPSLGHSPNHRLCRNRQMQLGIRPSPGPWISRFLPILIRITTRVKFRNYLLWITWIGFMLKLQIYPNIWYK